VNDKFVYLEGAKLKTRVVTDGVEHWSEVCHFTEDNTLVIFRVSVLERPHTKTLTLTVQERMRRQPYRTNLTTTSRARIVMVLRLAEQAIADRMADLNRKLAITIPAIEIP
jgi:hypothetical protein